MFDIMHDHSMCRLLKDVPGPDGLRIAVQRTGNKFYAKVMLEDTIFIVAPPADTELNALRNLWRASDIAMDDYTRKPEVQMARSVNMQKVYGSLEWDN